MTLQFSGLKHVRARWVGESLKPLKIFYMFFTQNGPFRVLSGIMDYGHGVPSLLSLTLLDFDLDYLSHEVRFTTTMVRKKCQKKKKTSKNLA